MRFLSRAAKNALIKGCTENTIREFKAADTLENRSGIAGFVHSVLGKAIDRRIAGELVPTSELKEQEIVLLFGTEEKTDKEVFYLEEYDKSSESDAVHVRYTTNFDKRAQGGIPKFSKNPHGYLKTGKVTITVNQQLGWLNALIRLVEEIAQIAGTTSGVVLGQIKGSLRQNSQAKNKMRLANGGRVSRGRKKPNKTKRLEHKTRLSGLRSAAGFYLNSKGESRAARSALLNQLNNAKRIFQIDAIRARLTSLKKDIMNGAKPKEVAQEIYELCSFSQQCHVVTKNTLGLTPAIESIINPSRLRRAVWWNQILNDVQRYNRDHFSDEISFRTNLELCRAVLSQLVPERTNVGSLDTMLGITGDISFVGTGRRVNQHVGKGNLKQSLPTGTTLPAYRETEPPLNLVCYYVPPGGNRGSFRQGMSMPTPGGGGAFALTKPPEARYVSRSETEQKLKAMSEYVGKDKWYDLEGNQVKVKSIMISPNEVGAAFFIDHTLNEGKVNFLGKTFSPDQIKEMLREEITSKGHNLTWSVPTKDNVTEAVKRAIPSVKGLA